MFNVLTKSGVAITFALLLLGGCQMKNGSQSPAAAAAPEEVKPTGPAVTVTEDETTYTLANGTVTAKVAKGTGDLLSLQYKGMETLFQQQGKQGAAFSQNATGGTGVVARITIDPKTNNG